MGMMTGLQQLPAAPRVTAALCTRDRPRQLRRALQSLAQQTHAPEEILVVDSHPTSTLSHDMVVNEYPGVRYVLEEAPGIGQARDRALREARHEIVAFLDDDAVAEPDWTEAIRTAMSGADRPAACTGRVEALLLETRAQRLFEANGGFDRGGNRIVLPSAATVGAVRTPLIAWAVSIGSGCSMALDRAAAIASGGFDSAFGAEPELPGGEDLDLLWRLIDAGHVVAYEPAVRARHEHRADMGELAAQLANHQRSLLAMLCKAAMSCTARRRSGTWLFLGWRLVKPGQRLLRRMVGRDPLPAGILLRMWRNAIAGPFAYWRARRTAGRNTARSRAGAVPQ